LFNISIWRYRTKNKSNVGIPFWIFVIFCEKRIFPYIFQCYIIDKSKAQNNLGNIVNKHSYWKMTGIINNLVSSNQIVSFNVFPKIHIRINALKIQKLDYRWNYWKIFIEIFNYLFLNIPSINYYILINFNAD
jgi:hypothetical protein